GIFNLASRGADGATMENRVLPSLCSRRQERNCSCCAPVATSRPCWLVHVPRHHRIRGRGAREIRMLCGARWQPMLDTAPPMVVGDQPVEPGATTTTRFAWIGPPRSHHIALGCGLAGPDTQNAPCGALGVSGGERGIRTPEARFRRLHTFQACSFNHSDTSPGGPGGRQPPLTGAQILAVARVC